MPSRTEDRRRKPPSAATRQTRRPSRRVLRIRGPDSEEHIGSEPAAITLCSVYVRPTSRTPTPSSSRVTHYLGRKAAASILHAPRNARRLRRPLNTLVTIGYGLVGFGEDRASAAFQRLREVGFLSWSRYEPKGTLGSRNGPPTYAWSIEAPGSYAHVHWMVHVRPRHRRAFERRLEGWMKRAAKLDTLPAGTIDIRPVANDEGLKLYLVKGMEPHLGAHWGIRCSDMGAVEGRRGGVSANLGPSVWKPAKAAYKAARGGQAA